MNRNIYISNTPLEDALKLWSAALEARGCLAPLPPEAIPVDDSLGRVTAEAVFAPRSSPFYNAAAMDGIAVSFASAAGASEAAPVRLREGDEYVCVNTGRPIPDGFDAVIMIEDVHRAGPGVVEIIEPVTPWKHIRPIGEDIVATELILPEGHLIRPIDVGAMLATGLTRVSVRRIPKALVIPTGDELVQPGEPVSPGNIVEFNGRVLAGYLREWGVEAARSEIVRDDTQLLEAAISRAVSGFDIVITNAGASAGTKDNTASVIAALGEVIVHGVNIKPGKPVVLGIVGGRPVIGLPGYPVSAVLTMRLFARGLAYAMRGLPEPRQETASAMLARPVSSKMGVNEFIRVKLGCVGENLMATPSGRGAGAVMSLVQADGILVVPAGSEGIGAGEKVTVELLRGIDEIENTIVAIGSHDNALDALANFLHVWRDVPRGLPRGGSTTRLSSAHVGSMGGILAIKRGEAHMAGTHLLDEETGEYNIAFIKRFLPDTPLLLVNLVYRTQGLLVPKGNPKGIRGFEDLARPDVTFINRQRGAGTRLLTDMYLKKLGIAPESVRGYDREEYTHMTVASAVASGSADCGLAILAAARALGLDFIPVAGERYDLIIPKAYADDAKIRALLSVIRENREFRETVERMGGYDMRDCGRVMYEQ
ncbi:MAG: molybdopterin biosynthesis protein [Nitrospirae bacterium]|nr:molybdopterin biosynthesis protein [Nitrospirota bacterium]